MSSIKKIRRFTENPIIYPDMAGLEGKRGTNIIGPSLIKVPDNTKKGDTDVFPRSIPVSRYLSRSASIKFCFII